MNEPHYNYRVISSAEDAEYMGFCAELPSLSWLAPTSAAARLGIRRLVQDVVDEMHGGVPRLCVETQAKRQQRDNTFGAWASNNLAPSIEQLRAETRDVFRPVAESTARL